MIILPKEITLWRICNHIIEIEKAKMKLLFLFGRKLCRSFIFLKFDKLNV